MKRYTLYILGALMIAVSLVACNWDKTYDNYRSVDVEGWNRSDTLDFNVGRIPQGDYEVSVGFRATSTYPFKELGFDISWTVYPSGKTTHKRVKCPIYDDSGKMVGKGGISSDDFIYRIGNISVGRADSVVVSVSHGMNQDIMPGITQVGIQLEPAQ